MVSIIPKSGKLRIGTRKSRLAMVQTQLFCQRLCDFLSLSHDDMLIVPISTHGDRVKDKPLAEIGSVGLFIKELEIALRQGQIDIAVHSLKDMQSVLASDMMIACVMPRDDPRDTLICKKASRLDALPQGCVVGTSSIRRQAQMCSYYDMLRIQLLRGNIETRLKAVDDGHVDATVLAQCGLDRLSIRTDDMHVIDTDMMLPAATQGIIAAEIRSDNMILKQKLRIVNDEETWYCAQAERSCLAAFNGGCLLPFAAFAELHDKETVYLRAQLLTHDGRYVYRAQAYGSCHDAVNLGKIVAKDLMEKAGDNLALILDYKK